MSEEAVRVPADPDGIDTFKDDPSPGTGAEESTRVKSDGKYTTVDEINRLRRDEQKRLAWEIVRLAWQNGQNPARRSESDAKIKHLQNECRVLERANMDLPAIIREIAHG